MGKGRLIRAEGDRLVIRRPPADLSQAQAKQLVAKLRSELIPLFSRRRQRALRVDLDDGQRGGVFTDAGSVLSALVPGAVDRARAAT